MVRRKEDSEAVAMKEGDNEDVAAPFPGWSTSRPWTELGFPRGSASNNPLKLSSPTGTVKGAPLRLVVV
ncbi:hypothetical protein PGTUg99_004597 [Puccinia graminis f. sp. tritici]|uniref:Uncharacterized protein n=1 Tax=Puccinia graminis f. sp. tritici TaxID=56615 RepID=A0A5B0MQP4_PUCGR|nr:hypothetical protein PGTUg99_004597 [Puccinia graminis f. sp. tritici]